MFEKESKLWATRELGNGFVDDIDNHSKTFQKGAEFGYNKAKVEVEDSYRESLCNSELNLASVTEQLEELEKANEWQYVSEKGTPKAEGHYLVCLRNKDKDILDCWILYDKDVGWYSMQIRIKDIYAWKEIVLPKEIAE